MKKLKVIYMGTPEFAATVLQKLLDSNLVEVVAVFTKPDYVVRKKIISSAVKTKAVANNIPVYTPLKLLPIYNEVKKLNPHLIITCAYGKIIPRLYLADFPAINIHASLLPQYRGASPIEHALFNNDSKTGITIISLVPELDAGPILLKEEITISQEDNKATLTSKLALLASELIIDYLTNKDALIPVAQDESLVSLAPPIAKDDEYLDLSLSCATIFGKIRGLADKPGAKLIINDQILTILEAKITNKKSQPYDVIVNKNELLLGTCDYFISIIRICQAGKKVLPIKDFLNGQKLFVNNTNLKTT